jgi:phage repressor protein C with HTH and peptisase S24 domain
MTMTPDERARAELAKLISDRREDFAGLSRLLGRNAAYVQQYVKRGTPKRLAEKDRRVLAKYFGVEEHLLGAAEKAEDSLLAKLVPVPRLQVSASAGHGSFADHEGAIAHMAFDPAWLRRITTAPAAELSIIRVQGDSMVPTLGDGDDILVDRSIAGRKLTDGIFVLRLDETLMVKRFAIHPSDNTLTISSDNSAYPSWTDCKRTGVNVIGRVIWAGRRLA